MSDRNSGDAARPPGSTANPVDSEFAQLCEAKDRLIIGNQRVVLTVILALGRKWPITELTSRKRHWSLNKGTGNAAF